MCAPAAAVVGIASLVLSLVGTGISVYSSYQEGKAQKEYYNYQAEIEKKNAERAKENYSNELQGGIEDARMQRMKTLKAIGSQKTAMAANGIDITSGSALDIIDDTAAMGELDALNILANSQRTANNYLTQSDNFQSQANLNKIAGQNAYKTGVYNSFGSLVSGAGSAVRGLGNLEKVDGKWKWNNRGSL